MKGIADRLEALLAQGVDEPMLRLTLARHYLDAGDVQTALGHAEVAVALDADYSAAWRLLGQIQLAAGRGEAARDTFARGIAVAEQRGDQQARREMQVFLRRLNKKQE